MSDTPRTDAAQSRHWQYDLDAGRTEEWLVSAEFAHRLERELNKSENLIADFRAEIGDLRAETSELRRELMETR